MCQRDSLGLAHRGRFNTCRSAASDVYILSPQPRRRPVTGGETAWCGGRLQSGSQPLCLVSPKLSFQRSRILWQVKPAYGSIPTELCATAWRQGDSTSPIFHTVLSLMVSKTFSLVSVLCPCPINTTEDTLNNTCKSKSCFEWFTCWIYLFNVVLD